MDKKKRRRKDGGKRVRGTTSGGHDGANAPSAVPSSRVAAPGFDPERYRHHIDHLDMPDDRKADLLRAVWQIMQSFVDRAFGDDPAQQCRKHVDGKRAKDETGLLPVVDSGSNSNTTNDLSGTFKKRAAADRTKENE